MNEKSIYIGDIDEIWGQTTSTDDDSMVVIQELPGVWNSQIKHISVGDGYLSFGSVEFRQTSNTASGVCRIVVTVGFHLLLNMGVHIGHVIGII